MVQRSILLLSLFVHFIFADVLSTGENVALFVDRMIGDNDVMIFAKSYCPYCMRTKSTFDKVLKELGFDEDELTYDVVELDQLPDGDGALIQDYLHEMTQQRTVPNVFIAGMHIGGNSDVEDLFFDGQLHTLLTGAA